MPTAGSLHDAAGRNDIRLVVSLLDNGANTSAIDENGAVPLHLAAAADAFEAARALIDSGAEVDATDGLGRTPLLLAVDNFESHGPLIELLRFAGANPHRAAADSRTPVGAAREAGGDVARYFASIKALPELPVKDDEPEPVTGGSRQRRGSGLFGRRRPN